MLLKDTNAKKLRYVEPMFGKAAYKHNLQSCLSWLGYVLLIKDANMRNASLQLHAAENREECIQHQASFVGEGARAAKIQILLSEAA